MTHDELAPANIHHADCRATALRHAAHRDSSKMRSRVPCNVARGLIAIVASALTACAAEDDASEREHTPGLMAPQGTLQVDLTPTELGDAQVEYRVTNSGEHPIWLLSRETALDGLTADLFSVELDGSPVQYVGYHDFAADPDLRDFVELGPGESLSARIDLTRAYEMRSAGQYAVRARQRIATVLGPNQQPAEDEHHAIVPASPEVQIELDTERSYGPRFAPKFNSTTNCSGNEVTALTNAEATADALLTDARTYMEREIFRSIVGGTNNFTPYVTWFGALAGPVYDVADVLRDVQPDLETVDYYCYDNGDVIYVDSAGNNVGCGASPNVDRAINGTVAPGFGVHLCPSILTAADRRLASVLVHESVHYLVGGHPDGVNTRNGALNQAASDPSKAARNAENYEHFVLEF